MRIQLKTRMQLIQLDAVPSDLLICNSTPLADTV